MAEQRESEPNRKARQIAGAPPAKRGVPYDSATGPGIELQGAGYLGQLGTRRNGGELLSAFRELEARIAAVQAAAEAMNRDLAALYVQGAIIAALIPAATSAGSPSAAWLGLTPRQRQVALQLAAGASDGEVARALGISRNTAKSHLRAVLTQLGLRSRREVAYVSASPTASFKE